MVRSQGLQESCQKHSPRCGTPSHSHPTGRGRGDTATLPPPASPSPARSVDREKQQLEHSRSPAETPNPKPIPMRANPAARRDSKHLHGGRAPMEHPQPIAWQLAMGALGMLQAPLLHTLTLEAVVGMTQRHVTAVNDIIDLLQEQRWAVSEDPSQGAIWAAVLPFSPLPPISHSSQGKGAQACLRDGGNIDVDVVEGGVDVGEGTAHSLGEASVADEGTNITSPTREGWQGQCVGSSALTVPPGSP